MAVYRRKALWVLLATCVAMSAPAVAGSEGEAFDRGRALYENHCQSCHEALAHTRDNRVVKTVDGLRQRVWSWSIHSGLNWRDDEIDDVTRYLNRRFYQLTP